MVNGLDRLWHPHNTVQYEHVLVRHEVQYDKHVDWAELKILGMQTLKIWYD